MIVRTASVAAAWRLLLMAALVMLAGAQFPFGNFPQSGIEGDRCMAPGGRPGVCLLIRDCPEYLALITGRPSPDSLFLLTRARCSFKGNLPVLCCPGQTSITQTTPPPWLPITVRPTPSQRPAGPSWSISPSTARPSPWQVTKPPPVPYKPSFSGGNGFSTDDAEPEDVSNHPNIQLLPQIYCGPVGTDRVTGGNETDIFTYPWMARLGYRRRSRPTGPPSYRCGGSLISNRYVLTAAHCVVLKGDFRLTTVKLGEHTISTAIDCKPSNNRVCLPPPVDVDVEEALVHPKYTSSSSGQNHHDIALLRLAQPIDFQTEEYLRPICLPSSRETQLRDLDDTKMTVAGWGTTEKGDGSDVLLEVQLPVVSLEKCVAAYNKRPYHRTIIPQQICAGGVAGKDSCGGDSGGPLMLEGDVEGESKTVLFGLVSFGPTSCGTPDVPGVYTRVGHYMPWILENMRP